jgi:hypothetical protein
MAYSAQYFLPEKMWYESATVWFNIASLVVVFLQQFTELKLISYFVTNPVQAGLVTSWLTGFVAIVNLFLRVFKTNQPLALHR